MTWAIDHRERHRRFSPFGRFGRVRRVETLPTGVRAWARPLGAGGVGLATLLLGAWAGISVFVGPQFNFRPTSSSAWEWTMQNWLLHLVPGAVAVFAGLVMLGTIGARGAGRRGGLGVASILTMAAGAWLVIGPSAYHWFQSAGAFALTDSARNDFINQVGANLGPGILLAILGGMAFKAGIANPRVVVDHVGEAGVAPGSAAVAPAGAGTMTTTAHEPVAADPTTGMAAGTPPAVGQSEAPAVDGEGGAGRSGAADT